MNRPLLLIGIALVAIGLTAGIFAVAFRDEWKDDDNTVEYRVLNADGQETGSVVVLEDGWRRGPGFFPFFPLIVIGGVLIAIAFFARGHGDHWRARRDFEDWHRETHWNWGSNGPKDPPASPPQAPA